MIGMKSTTSHFLLMIEPQWGQGLFAPYMVVPIPFIVYVEPALFGVVPASHH